MRRALKGLRCVHNVPAGCAECRAFNDSVRAAVADLSTWKPGVLAELNRQSAAVVSRAQEARA